MTTLLVIGVFLTTSMGVLGIILLTFKFENMFSNLGFSKILPKITGIVGSIAFTVMVVLTLWGVEDVGKDKVIEAVGSEEAMISIFYDLEEDGNVNEEYELIYFEDCE